VAILIIEQTVVNCFYLPGCIVGGLLMDRIGRKQTMTLGFVLWSIMGFIIGGALKPIQTVFALFVVLYGIFNSLGEMGPGVATFLCASESFPTPFRGHFLGFAAAVGKAGAAIGTTYTPVLRIKTGERLTCVHRYSSVHTYSRFL
jgi:MFS family permease